MNHPAQFDIDEAALTTGIRAMLTIATDFFNSPAPYLGRLA